MRISGRSADNSLVEIMELEHHPWFVGSQFHPEFKSRPTRPHPLFRDFVGACLRVEEDKQHEAFTAFEREVVGASAELAEHASLHHSSEMLDARIEK